MSDSERSGTYALRAPRSPEGRGRSRWRRPGAYWALLGIAAIGGCTSAAMMVLGAMVSAGAGNHGSAWAFALFAVLYAVILPLGVWTFFEKVLRIGDDYQQESNAHVPRVSQTAVARHRFRWRRPGGYWIMLGIAAIGGFMIAAIMVFGAVALARVGNQEGVWMFSVLAALCAGIPPLLVWTLIEKVWKMGDDYEEDC